MDIEEVREYCLSLPMTSEDSAFGDDILLFRVYEKIFLCMPLDGNDYIALKCDPDYAVELREKHSEITPAYHWNKKYWNQLNLNSKLDTAFIKTLIRHSYAQVVSKLPKKIKTANPQLTTIS